MSNVRDELQQWVDGVDATHEDGLADLTHDVIPVDLARRVLAEMSETETVIEDSDSSAARIHRSLESTREKLKGVRAERDAALATLAEVRELRDEYRAYLDSGQNQDDPIDIGPILSAKGVVHALTAILDRSRPDE